MTLPPVVILCGGRGTRLREHAGELPKPLVEIGDRPILWHVMQAFIAQGARRFVLCAGHQRERIAAFTDATAWPEGVVVECVDTGPDTPTGGRIHRVRERLDGTRFMVAYADGLADIDFASLWAYHSTTATLTVVQPELQYGIAELDGDRVTGFAEKPRAPFWINGGFFCFEPGVFDYLDDGCTLEREPMARLAEAGELRAFRHRGFWACMDTYKDTLRLNDLWASGQAPWNRPRSG
ncbi:MAG TPA: sugar phosphate nucleotidyltransferase [Solirubrobacter sp.]|nr:sugar phosphate nucleotidyltransferase [Solirubrobacter sp.]